MDAEQWTKSVVMAKRRVMEAAGATCGRIGDPGEFLLALIEVAREYRMFSEFQLLCEDSKVNRYFYTHLAEEAS